ncbi:MAG: response regulator [Desulfobulbaceae bacterium]|nr:response regulator [Desulfobulbaceae bacterium]
MASKHQRILVVDKDLAHGKAIAQAFVSELDTTVKVASTIKEFKHLIAVPASQRPDLVIMDLDLPDGSAHEIISPSWEEGMFPVLLMIDPDRVESVMKAMPAGVVDFVVKAPWTAVTMPHKARSVLREWRLFNERRTSLGVIQQLAYGWQRTFDAIPYPVFMRNMEGVITQCNQAMLDFYDKAKDEIVGFYCWEIVHDTGTAIHQCPMPSMLESRQREIVILTVDDRIFQVSVDPVADNDGVIIGAVHSMEDITDRQHAEETLRAQEAELAAIYENAPFVMMLVDNQCKVRKLNRRSLSLAGINHLTIGDQRGGEILGCFHAFSIPDARGYEPSCRDCTISLTVRDTIESGNSHHQVEVMVTMEVEGKTMEVPFLLSTSRIILRGEAMALVSFVNIRQLKQAEEELGQINERMTSVMDSLNALIYVADMSTYEILFINKYGRDIWGNIEGQICWQSLQSGQDGPCAFCSNERLLDENGFPTGVYVWEFQNTKTGRWYDCRDQAIRWNDGRMVRIEIATDITERKLSEEQIRHSQKMDTIGTLAGGIAHDFNNILTSILGFANLAHDDLSPESQTYKDIQQVISAGERAKELVKQILTFSRQRTEECQPVQASLLIKEALKLLRSSIPATIAIRDYVTAKDQTILIDPTKLHQVVMNLCTNAYQSMKQGGTLSVSLEPLVVTEGDLFGHDEVPAGEYLRLAVQDTGCGMDQSTIERIFEPYFTTKDKENGTGLGLSVVHGIVRNSNGFISVQSVLGQGSEFQVIWPMMKKGATLHTQGIAKSSLPRGTEHILLVDDEPGVLTISERALRSLGYTVTSRTCASDAIKEFGERPEQFALVITDYAMPEMDGLVMAQKLLAISSGVKIILSTGFSDVLTKDTMVNSAIQRVLLKPVLRRDLALAVRSVIDNR